MTTQRTIMLAASIGALLVLGAPALGVSAAPPVAAPIVSVTQFGTTIVIDQAFRDTLRATTTALTLERVVLGDGRVVSLALEPFEVVSPDVRVDRARHTHDRSLAETARGVTHFRGTVVGEADSLVYIAASERGVAAWIDVDQGKTRYTLRPIEEPRPGLVRGAARFDRSYGIDAPCVPLCGGVHGEPNDAGGVAGSGVMPHGAVPTIEMALDADYEYFAIFGDLKDALEYAISVYGATSAIYLRDVGTRVVVTYTRIFDVPDDLYNDADPLYQFRDDWNQNMQAIDRDVAHLVTGRRNLPYGGVAWLDATCSDFGYGVVGYIIGSFADPVGTNPGNWDINVIAHELGHNVGSQHTHWYNLDSCDTGEVRRGSIMSYCHINSGASSNIDLFFHSVCVEDMASFIVTSSCLESDCDGDGVPDSDAIAAGAPDVDGDGVPDACQDCDGDGVLDSIAIAQLLVTDVDADGTPDRCQPDCNGNSIPDSFDIASQTSTDAYGDGIPDECEADCNANGISDYTEIQLDMTLDRSRDGVLDACEDCDGDGTPDFAELAGSQSIWTGGTDNTVRELHPRSGVLMRSFTLDAEVFDLDIGPDGLLYASAGRKVYPINRATGVVLPAIVDFSGSSNSVRGIALTDDGALLVARAPNGVAKYTTAGQFVAWLGGSPNAAPSPRDVAVRADGRVLVTCADGRIRQFKPDGSSTPGFDGSLQLNDYYGVIESPDGQFIVVASRAIGGLVRFNAATGQYLGRFDVQPGSFLTRASGIALAADGTAYLATSSASSSTLNGYDIATGYLERTYRSYGSDAGPAQAICVAPPSATDTNGNLIPDVCEAVGADLNGDGLVNATDLAILLGAWGTPERDLDGDGTTSASDLAILLGAWTSDPG